MYDLASIRASSRCPSIWVLERYTPHPNLRSQLNKYLNMTPPLWCTCSSHFPRISLFTLTKDASSIAVKNHCSEDQCHKPRPAYRYHIISEFPIRVRSFVVGSIGYATYSRSREARSSVAYWPIQSSDCQTSVDRRVICDRTSHRLAHSIMSNCWVTIL